MKKYRIPFSILLLILACVVLLLNLERFRQTSQKPVTLNFYIMNELENQAHVLEAFENQTMNSLGLKINLKSQSPDAYERNLSKLLRTQSNVDLVFDAPWAAMSQNIADGLYTDLEPYLESGDYPGLNAAFSRRYLDDSRINGKIYGLPITKNFYDPPGIIYRKDLLESYDLGFDSITNLKQLRKFYDAVLEHNPEMFPLSVGSRGFFYLLFEDSLKLPVRNIFDVNGISWPIFPVKAVLSPDHTRVLGILFLGDSEQQLQAMGSQVTDIFSDAYLRQARWNRYLGADSLMSSDSAYALLNGTAASYENTLGEGTISLQDSLREQVPEGTLAFFPSDTSLQGDLTGLTIPKDLSAWNYICIPKNSRHIEETLSFLDWLFSSQEHNDLFTYGVEGIDWISTGSMEYSLSAQTRERYKIAAYTFCYHPSYLRYEQRLNENEKELISLTADPDTFTGSPLTGFGLDYSSFSERWNEILELYKEYHLLFMHGSYGPETKAKIHEFHQRAEALGLEEMRMEILQQVQAFLDAKQ